jgi:tol-pal system protein YbgF
VTTNDLRSNQLARRLVERAVRPVLSLGAIAGLSLLFAHAQSSQAHFAIGGGGIVAPAPNVHRTQAQPLPPAAPRTQPKSAAPKRESSGVSATDSQLRQRVEQLEEQLVDMQVLVGTLESLARSGGGASSAPRAGSGPLSGASEAARIDALETQVRAMTLQIEQLSQQLRQQSGRRDEGSAFERGGAVMPPAAQPQSAPSGFGSVTVTPQGGRDPIGQIISASPRSVDSGPLPPTVSDANSPKELYETAHGYLLQRDYAAAEASFEEFLRRYPNDPLAADAQYWMGETLYTQGRFKPAGQAFLKVVQQHRQSPKAANSLLMLAMSLEQLGQKDCALFAELEARHPNAPAEVRNRARTVKQRVGC